MYSREDCNIYRQSSPSLLLAGKPRWRLQKPADGQTGKPSRRTDGHQAWRTNNVPDWESVDPLIDPQLCPQSGEVHSGGGSNDNWDGAGAMESSRPFIPETSRDQETNDANCGGQTCDRPPSPRIRAKGRLEIESPPDQLSVEADDNNALQVSPSLPAILWNTPISHSPAQVTSGPSEAEEIREDPSNRFYPGLALRDLTGRLPPYLRRGSRSPSRGRKSQNAGTTVSGRPRRRPRQPVQEGVSSYDVQNASGHGH